MLKQEVPIVDSQAEEPMFFASGSDELFGILTVPTVPANGEGVVLMTARGTFHRNRLSVRLARRLARRGFHVLRFDFRGVGESSGAVDFDLSRPSISEVSAAAQVLRERSLRRIRLVGSCFGATSALAAAEGVEGLSGIVLAVVPFADAGALPAPRLRTTGKRVLRLLRQALVDPGSYPLLLELVRAAVNRQWQRLAPRPEPRAESPDEMKGQVGDWLERLLERQVPTLLLFGAEDAAYNSFHDALAYWPEDLRRTVEQLVDIRVAAHQKIHGRARIEAQDWMIDTIESWLVESSQQAAGPD